MARSSPRTAPAIVVLGARVLEDGVPSGRLRARVERAAELYRAGAAPLLVLSGGVGEHPPSEAQVMLKLAVELGVPAGCCVLEEQSRSTYENAKFTARLLRERGIGKAILVSDPFHLYRARQHFFLEGIDVTPEPALPGGRLLPAADRLYWIAREIVALLRRPRLLFASRPRQAPVEGQRPGPRSSSER